MYLTLSHQLRHTAVCFPICLYTKGQCDGDNIILAINLWDFSLSTQPQSACQPLAHFILWVTSSDNNTSHTEYVELQSIRIKPRWTTWPKHFIQAFVLSSYSSTIFFKIEKVCFSKREGDLKTFQKFPKMGTTQTHRWKFEMNNNESKLIFNLQYKI